MAFWLGGLAYFFTGIRRLRGLDSGLRTRLTSLLTARFSVNALVFVSLIGMTGFYSAYLRVGSAPALLDTLYGHVLLIKQAFVVGLLVIAATNLLVISPRLKQDRLQGLANADLVERFRKLLIVELTFNLHEFTLIILRKFAQLGENTCMICSLAYGPSEQITRRSKC